jgi:hypothetical protein
MSVASFVLLASGKQYGGVVKQEECLRDNATIRTHSVSMISQDLILFDLLIQKSSSPFSFSLESCNVLASIQNTHSLLYRNDTYFLKGGM